MDVDILLLLIQAKLLIPKILFLLIHLFSSVFKN